MSDSFEAIVEDIRAERARQDLKFGLQRHPLGTSVKFKPLADAARKQCQAAAANGTVTWMHIAREEFWEAMSETERAALRVEWVQLIAVGVAIVEQLDEEQSA